MVKNCPEGKILNPATGRCVKKDGKIGKDLLKASRKVSKKSSRKVSKKASRKVSRKASRKVSKKASRKVSRKVSRKASRKVSKKASRKVSRKASRKVSKKASRKQVHKSKKISSAKIKKVFPKKLLEKEFKVLHPTYTLSTEGYEYLLKILTPLYEKSIPYLEDNDVKGFLNLIPGDLRKYADIEQTTAGTKVNNDAKLDKFILGENFDFEHSKYSKEINYRFATIFEYLLAEIMEISGGVVLDDGRKKVMEKDIKKAIAQDKELNKIF